MAALDLSNPQKVAKLLLPKVPFLFKTAALHSLSISKTSSKWDLRTELIVNLIRSFLENPNPEPLSKTQKGSLRDPGVKGRIWVSRYTIPRPAEDDVRQALFKAIDDAKDGNEIYTKPDIAPVEVEWTGYRNDAKPESPELDVTEPEKYHNLTKEVTSEVVFLYFHGGAYYLME
jgi:hypothetical protein